MGLPNTQDSASEERAGKIVRMMEHLRANRGNLDGHCQEIAQVIWANQSRMFQRQNASPTFGEKRTEYVFDSSAASALNKFTSILDSLLTPMDKTWHMIVADDELLQKDRPTRLWLEELNRNLFKKRYAASANFISQNQLVYKGMGAYGTSGLFVDEYRGRRGAIGFRYRNIHLSELFVLENHQGVVEVVYRYYKAKAHQIVERFSKRCPDKIKEIARTAPDTEFFLIHCVEPRDNVDYERADFAGMEYASYYVLEDSRWLLEEHGYESFPYGVSRYEQDGASAYGRSPAMDGLPAMKTLNEEKKTLLTQGHRAIAPPLFAYDDGVLDVYNLRPGALNFGGVSADGKQLVHAMPVGNLSLTKEMMDDERIVINDLFLVPLFQMLEKNPQMTATEVVQRAKEQGILLAPTVGRQYAEYHGRVIEREIDLEMRQNVEFAGRMPPMLIEAGGMYRLRYDSPMARMQRAEEAAGIMHTIDTAISISSQTGNPEPLDYFDWDEIIPELCDIGGVPKKWLKDPKDIAAIRDGRAKQAEAQQSVQAAPAAAALIKSQAAAKQKAVA